MSATRLIVSVDTSQLTIDSTPTQLVLGAPFPVVGSPVGNAGGDLASQYPNPEVIALHETSGPDRLSFADIEDGLYLRRSGIAVVGDHRPNLLTGSGNPTGIVNGVLGQNYHDLVSKIWYRCISSPSGNAWVTI